MARPNATRAASSRRSTSRLSALGLQQAARAAELLAGEPIRSIVSSNVNRALTTAHTVSAPHGIAPLVFEGLRERNFGALIGTSSATSTGPASPRAARRCPSSSPASAPRSNRRWRTRAGTDRGARRTLYVLAALLGVPST